MKEQAPIRKHTLNLYEGDYERLQVLFPEVGAAAAIRRIVRKFLEENETRQPVAEDKMKEVSL